MIKSFLQTHQQKIVLVVGYLLVGFIGFGLGQIAKSSTEKPEIRIEQAFAPLNDTANSLGNQTGSIGQNEQNSNTSKPLPTPSPSPAPTPTPTTAGLDCAGKIKGNISGKNKIYHLPGSSFYNRTSPEACFSTEEEAKAAGFRKSGG